MGIVRPSTFNLQPSTLATRRSALKGLAGILATGVAPSLCAASTGGYRRGLGMRMAAFGGGGDTIHGFVKKGLIGYWDGKDNVGLGDGHHVSSLSEWKNLVGNVDLSFGTGYVYIGSDFVSLTNSSTCYANFSNPASPITIEYDIFYISWIAEQAIIDWRESISSSYSLLTHYSYQEGTEYVYPISKPSGQTTILKNSIPLKKHWYHFAIVLTDTGTKIYRDGQILASNNKYSIYAPLGYLQVNRYGTNRGPQISYRAIRIYNRALSEEEVVSNYNAEVLRFPR